MKSVTRLLAACILLPAPFVSAASLPYPIVGTGQTACYGDRGPIDPPDPGEPFCGQDAQRGTTPPHYRDNGDGTVTGLMWQRDPGSKMTFDEAEAAAKACRLGGHDDWRIPTVKELYSLILFTGESQGEQAVRPYIDTRYFIQPKADTDSGEREIDVQTWSCTRTSDPVMGGQEAAFGVNFADGRIKGYPLSRPDGPNRLYFRFVRGNPDYGRNLLFDNGDGTVSDYATGLMWQKADAGRRMDWESALVYAEALTLADHSDWHLPTAKELQSIVDYTRTPPCTPSSKAHRTSWTTASATCPTIGPPPRTSTDGLSGHAPLISASDRPGGAIRAPASGPTSTARAHSAATPRSRRAPEAPATSAPRRTFSARSTGSAASAA